MRGKLRRQEKALQTVFKEDKCSVPLIKALFVPAAQLMFMNKGRL